MEDLLDPVPEWAPAGWCLAGYGGRLLIRGYDTFRSTLQDLRGPDGEVSSRWALDDTRVPVTARSGAGVAGPAGPVSAGDCVVFVGVAEGSDEVLAWFPQRVIAVDAPSGGWQRVWAIRDLHTREEMCDVRASALGTDIGRAEPLRGEARRRVLELFGLNVYCESCGRMGGLIEYGCLRVPVSSVEFVSVEERREGDPDYACACGATWSVAAAGSLSLTEPPPIM